MKVYANFPHELPAAPRYSVVSVGVFDGLHRGHQRILAAALEGAPAGAVAVVTFDPHPRAVLGPPKRARLLSPLPERLELLGSYPLGAVAVLRFDQQLARMSYVDFVRDFLCTGLGARRLVLGYNVSLGHERQGNQERLRELGGVLGFEVRSVPAFEIGGAPVSSTRIRHLLDAGNVEAAAELLGRPYALQGTVVRGSGRGRAIGIPTANLQLSAEKLVPARGVYAARVGIEGRLHAGALNIGVVPTFVEEGTQSVEVHILDFDGDLYGAGLRLECIARLRDERKFSGPEALVAQIRQDIAQARAACAQLD
ncbi:MAG TPA: bifunctional riboflavin kinase/FAD synthetase [Candidatus Krumholzibacteria bacterium]|nr:bifunctional riboflavin kinase/FAD synthetase [Candidatus Krumholzibacteria bacterium]